MTGAGMMDCKAAMIEGMEILKSYWGIEKEAKTFCEAGWSRSQRGCVWDCIGQSWPHQRCSHSLEQWDWLRIKKNEDFVNTAKHIAQIALEHFPSDPAALNELPINGVAIKDKVSDMIATIGEKIGPESYEKLEARLVSTLYPYAG